jgi:purine-binding chemotaxis protein CheW
MNRSSPGSEERAMNALVQTHQRSSTAALLAAAPPEPAQYLTFLLAGEVFAIGILAIKEIIEYHGVTEVPMMPAAVRGVINLRGAVVPVVDPLARFGRPSSPITKRSCIVIVEVEGSGGDEDAQVIGVVVDAVNEVVDIAAQDIEPAPAFGARIRGDFIRGVGKVRGKFVILLDPNCVLSVEELGAGKSAAVDPTVELDD